LDRFEATLALLGTGFGACPTGNGRPVAPSGFQVWGRTTHETRYSLSQTGEGLKNSNRMELWLGIEVKEFMLSLI
jgi:hypothetical protein